MATKKAAKKAAAKPVATKRPANETNETETGQTPNEQPVTNAGSTDADPAVASDPKPEPKVKAKKADPRPEPEMPNLASVTDVEHPKLHQLYAAYHDPDGPQQAVEEVDVSFNHPIVQKYKEALLASFS